MSRRTRSPHYDAGFTLIEVMTVTAIVAILAAIALPNYFDYVQRSKIIEATTALSDARTRMEQYFLDNRTYVDGCKNAKTVTSNFKNAKAFTIDCPTETATTYTFTAVGKSAEGMSGFQYSIDETDLKKTDAVPSGWSKSGTCWSTRKDGTCG